MSSMFALKLSHQTILGYVLGRINQRNNGFVFQLKVNFPFQTDRKDVSNFTAQLCKKSIQLVPFFLAQVALSAIYI